MLSNKIILIFINDNTCLFLKKDNKSIDHQTCSDMGVLLSKCF